MFQVGRFDPRDEDRKKSNSRSSKSLTREPKHGDGYSSRKKKRTKESTVNNAHKPSKNESTLRVIAPETKGPVSSQKNLTEKLSVEAFDDLDIPDDLRLEVESGLNDDDDDDGKEEENHDSMQNEDAEIDGSSDMAIDPTDEVQRALHISRQPIQQVAERLRLAPFLIENLKRDGYENFFPIQALVLPDVIATERHAHMQARDVCVAAPTGSGKTLAFVLPVLNSLADRQIRRLRALVMLPSRDLAKQVFDVFQRYSDGSDLKIGIAVGQSDFLEEQKALTVGNVDQNTGAGSLPCLSKLRYHYDPGNIKLALDAAFDDSGFDCEVKNGGNMSQRLQIPRGGISAVDVLVCTPGRLVDHLDNTPGFTLQHLRYLVIDEADRLLSQSYHNWINRVLDSTNASSFVAWNGLGKKSASEQSQQHVLQESADHCSFVMDPMTWRHHAGSMGESSLSAISSSSNTNGPLEFTSVCQPVQLRKLLYSATLTKDPQKLATLRLVNPKHFDAHYLRTKASAKGEIRNASGHVYIMPDTLEEYAVECTAEQKPIALLALLLEQIQKNRSRDGHGDNQAGKHVIVVFTSSLESTHRLARLLQLLWGSADFGEPSLVGEFSSSITQNQRSELMRRCNDPSDPLAVVVCSDGMSRGMDIEFVSAVVNYDVPGFAKTYVHRCGRTARANKSGVAISLLKGGQVGQFGKMRRLIASPDRVQTRGVQKSLIRDAIPVYRSCVANLRAVLEAEKEGKLDCHDVHGLGQWIGIETGGDAGNV